MNAAAWLLTGLLFTGLLVATAYVVAGDLIEDFLDALDPMAAFTDELQAEVDALLEREAEWARDRVEFAMWDREFPS